MNTTIPSPNAPIVLENGFTPFYTPKEILLMGAFGGSFFSMVSYKQGIPEKFFNEIPKSQWGMFAPRADVNYFKILVPIRARQQGIPNGLRMQDQQGWFQWYTKFYYGKRSPADAYRIAQWKDEVKTLFHYIKYGTGTGSNNKITDLTQFKDWRQHLLHFAWDPTIDPDTIIK